MKKSERKNRTSKLRQKEFLGWMAIIIMLSFIIFIGIYYYENSFETHSIMISDVDGMIVGSPVHLMGVPVGYITKIRMLDDDEILVKFKISDKNIHILKGTIATVEFNGLGGSKSLELYSPDSSKEVYPNLVVPNNDYFLVERPKRLRDAWSLLYQMYNKLINIIYTVSNFGSLMKNIDTDSVSPKKSDTVNFVKYADSWIDNSTMNMYKYRKILNTYKKVKEGEQR